MSFYRQLNFQSFSTNLISLLFSKLTQKLNSFPLICTKLLLVCMWNGSKFSAQNRWWIRIEKKFSSQFSYKYLRVFFMLIFPLFPAISLRLLFSVSVVERDIKLHIKWPEIPMNWGWLNRWKLKTTEKSHQIYWLANKIPPNYYNWRSSNNSTTDFSIFTRFLFNIPRQCFQSPASL